MELATRSYTFAHLIRRMAIALTAALGLNMAVSLLAVRAVWSEQKQGASDKISGITLQINSILHGIEQTVSGELSYDTDIMRLCVSGGANYLSPIEKYRIEKRLKNMLEAWRGQFGFTMNYVIYVPETDTAVTGCSVSEDYLLWYGIEDEVKGYMRKNAPDRYLVGDLWHMARFGGENYAVYYSRMDECYMLCYISEKSFLGSIASGSQDAEEAAYFLPGEAGISGGGIWPGQADADFSEYEDGEIDTGLAGSRITARMSLANADFSVGIISSDNDHIISLVIFQLVLELLLVITSAGCLGLVFYIRRTVILPIQAFSSDLERLKEDDTYTVATHYQINELGKASALLEGMVRRIKKMKIDIYERTLKEQQIELDFLALQIEPHFYLNCLNIIYNLAELERYKEIQSLSKNVSDYMRYIFRHRNDLVLFKDELGHIKKYLEIQTIRYPADFWRILTLKGRCF